MSKLNNEDDGFWLGGNDGKGTWVWADESAGKHYHQYFNLKKHFLKENQKY